MPTNKDIFYGGPFASAVIAGDTFRDGYDGPRAMSLLAESFPGLRGRAGVSPWDAVKFWQGCRGLSSGELDAAAFVLGVFNPDGSWFDADGEDGLADDGFEPGPVMRFDLHHAMGIWDNSNRDAFLGWAQQPWWP